MKNFPGFLVLIIVACSGFNCNQSLAMNHDPALLQVEVYAKQFSWTIRYGGRDNELGASNYKFITEKNPLGLDSTDVKGYDDIIVTDTFFLPAEQVELSLHSRDVIHSAYFPQLRAQMNVVPGMTTSLLLNPEKTTSEMRKTLSDSTYDFMLLCNKICGAQHFEMKMKIVVGTREEFWQWLNRHKPFFDGRKPVEHNEVEGDGK